MGNKKNRTKYIRRIYFHHIIRRNVKKVGDEKITDPLVDRNLDNQEMS
jgi:hypothetical protein